VDASGAAYVTGSTDSSKFPTTAGAFQTTFGGGYYDAFVTKLAMVGGTAKVNAFQPPQQYWAKVAECDYGSTNCASPGNYHTGKDSTGSLQILASGPGIVAKITRNVPCNPKKGNCMDYGLSNSVIIQHFLTDGSTIYTLYAHLSSIKSELRKGRCVSKGEVIGKMGGSGYGKPNYWATHLHFEFKMGYVIGAPLAPNKYWGYTPTPPDNWGYRDPNAYVDKVLVVTPAKCK
jgi:murein DD-endopeptidase MepM/ murein hydrolase activator NlpD